MPSYGTIDLLLNSGSTTASASSTNGSEISSHGFDGIYGSAGEVGGNFWTSQVGVAMPQWVQQDLGVGNAVVIAEYGVAARTDYGDGVPSAWEFQGSNDGSSWTTLDTQTGQSFPGGDNPQLYPISNSTAYRYYRLNITASNNSYVHIMELQGFALAATNITVTSSAFSLTASLLIPTVLYNENKTISVSPFSLTSTLLTPTLRTGGSLSYASKIISYNPLIIVSNTSPVTVSFVDVSSPDTPVYTMYTYAGCNNALDVVYNASLGKIYVACSDGIILEINASTPTSYIINNTGAVGNLTSLAVLSSFLEVFGGTDYNLGEIVSMYEGSAAQIVCDIRASQVINSIVGTNIHTVNGAMVSTDIRCSALVNSSIGCDIRCIDEAFADLSITPISRPDFHVFIDDTELTGEDVQLSSIEITHTADEKSQATFILARKHDNVNYLLNPDGSQGAYVPILGSHTVKITIAGHEEFGYDTPAYIWDIDTKSANEEVKIVAYSQLPKQDERSTVTLSIPAINDKLHVYHALIDNPEINNPILLPDDINPPFYLGILIDAGYQRIQNITQLMGFYSAGQTPEQFVNYIFGSGDSGVYDYNGNNMYFKPLQNWTYFWFGMAYNFITGDTWDGLFGGGSGNPLSGSGSSYLGTSPSSLTSKTWDATYINFWYQRQFPDTEYRLGTATVYPSDFLGILKLDDPLTQADEDLGIPNPFGGNTTIDAIMRDHTPTTYTGIQLQQLKQRLANENNGNDVNASDQTIVTRELSTKILDLIESKCGVTFGSAPYKKVSCKNGILMTYPKWEDKQDGLYLHTEEGYNYSKGAPGVTGPSPTGANTGSYINLVGNLEFEKIQNINGSVLPKVKCDVEVFLDGYYHYSIQLLKRINIDNTVEESIYNENNGFPVSVKSIRISARDMKVSLQCTNAWSRLELLEIEGQMPDENNFVVSEKLSMIPGAVKFDPNSLMDVT